MDQALLHQVLIKPGTPWIVRTGLQPGNFFRQFALPSQVSHWSLRSIQLKLVKI